MRFRLSAALFLLLLCALFVSAQSVVITPRRVTYRRPKPMQDFKRTFTIRKPIATASNAALSAAITRAIDPLSVLQINLKEEQGEYQWLEQADYKVLYNANGVLTIELWMEGTAAYPDSVTRRVVVDLTSGKRVHAADAFQDLPSLAAMIKKAQGKEIAASIQELKKNPDMGEGDPSELFSEADFKVADLKEFSVDATGVTFYYDYGFPHVIQALKPDGEFKFTWAQLKPYIRSTGLLARFIR